MHKSKTLFYISTYLQRQRRASYFYVSLFTFCLFTFAASLAQENKVTKTDTTQTTNSNLPNSPQAEQGDVKITDGTHTLIRITDEGTFGAIEINPGVPSTTTDKLYNDNGTLKFGTTSLGGGTTTYAVGDLTQGGYVIEVTPDGKHGIVATLQNQGSVSWYAANDVLSDEAYHEVSGKNFKDWRLPTKREFNLIYNLQASIGGFSSSYSDYWCSTEYDSADGWYQVFTTGAQGHVNKGGPHRIRAVRVF